MPVREKAACPAVPHPEFGEVDALDIALDAALASICIHARLRSVGAVKETTVHKSTNMEML